MNKQICKLIIVSLLSIALASLIFFLHKEFIQGFISGQLLGIFITVIGFSHAGVMFLLGSLTQIEERKGKKYFTNSRKELKEDIIFQISSFIIVLIGTGLLQRNICENLTNIVSVVIITLFILTIYSMYSIASLGIKLSEDRF
jgi:hypothetical protein